MMEYSQGSVSAWSSSIYDLADILDHLILALIVFFSFPGHAAGIEIRSIRSRRVKRPMMKKGIVISWSVYSISTFETWLNMLGVLYGNKQAQVVKDFRLKLRLQKYS